MTSKKTAARNETSILIKLMIPVIILGILAIISSIIGFISLTMNQNRSKLISGDGLDAIVAYSEINLAFEKSQKLTFAYLGSPNRFGMTEQVFAELDTYSAIIDEYKEQLRAMQNTFTAEDIEAMEAIFTRIDDAESKIQELLVMGADNRDKAIYTANSYRDAWSTNIGSKLDALRASNIERIELLTREQADVYKLSSVLLFILIIGLALLFIATVFLIQRTIIRPLKLQKRQLYEVIDGINTGNGDLTRRITVRSNDEIGNSSAGINKFIETLQNIMHKIISNSNILDKVSGNVAASISSSNDNARDISAIMQELSATMEQIAATAATVNDNTISAEENIKCMSELSDSISIYSQDMKLRAAELENTAADNMADTRKVVTDIISEMNTALENSRNVEKVGQLTDDILSISKQTNLLALNASIEAARAGDAGKGFSVVADEIRELADSSRNTANNIQEINELVIRAVKDLVSSSHKILDYIQDKIMPDYEAFVQGGRQYSADASHIDSTMSECALQAHDILINVTEIAESISGISTAVDESAQGVCDAATNVDALVESIAAVSLQMEENRSVAKTLQAESANFVSV